MSSSRKYIQNIAFGINQPRAKLMNFL